MSDEILKTIENRHCKRHFLDKKIDKAILEKILLAARQAPSSKNTQPWQVTILSGKKRDELSEEICKKFDAGITEESEYKDNPDPLPDFFMDRARACGYALFELKGIGRKDYEARQKHNRENFTFFNAPVEMIFHLPAGSAAGTFLDMGFFMQNVMLGITAMGLGSCPQYSVASYANTVKSVTGIATDRIIVSGLAVGYIDEDKEVNTFVPEREPLSNICQWLDD